MENREDVDSRHADDLLRRDVPPDAIADVVHVTFLFDMVNHVADALGFDLLDERGYDRTARSLLRFGYRLPGPLRRLAARHPAW